MSATPAALSGVVYLHTGFVPDSLEVDVEDITHTYTATTRPFGAKQIVNDAHCPPGSNGWCYAIQVESAPQLVTAYTVRPIAYLNKANPYLTSRIPFPPSPNVNMAGAGVPVVAPDIHYTPSVVSGSYAVSDLANQPLPILSDYMSFNDLTNTYAESCGGSLDFCPYNPVTQSGTPGYSAYLQPGEDYSFLSQGVSLSEGPAAQSDLTFDHNLHLGTLANGQTLTANRTFHQVAQVSGSAQLPVPIYQLWMDFTGTSTTIDPLTHAALDVNTAYRTLNYVGPGAQPLASTSYVGRIFDNFDLLKAITMRATFTLSLDGGTVLTFPPTALDFSQGNQITKNFTGQYGTVTSRVTLVPPYPIKNGVYPGVQALELEGNGTSGQSQTTYVTDANGASFVLPAFGTPAYAGAWNYWRFGWSLDLGDPNFDTRYFVGQFLNIPVQVSGGGDNVPADFVFQTALVKVYFSSPAQPPGTTLSDPTLVAYSDDGDSITANGLNQTGFVTGEARMVLRAHNGQNNSPVAFHITPSAVINTGGAPGSSRTDFSPIVLFPHGGDVTVVGVPGSIALTINTPSEGQVFPICQIPVGGLSTGQPGIGIKVNGQSVAAPSTNNPGDPLQVSFNTTLTPAPGQFTITVTADDGNGHSVSDVRHVSCLQPLNQPPVITCPGPASAVCSSQAGGSTSLTVGIADPNNDALQISWSVDGNPVATHNAAPGAATDTYTGVFSPYGHTVVVTASDGKGGTASCTTTVDVPNPVVTTTVQTKQFIQNDHTLVNPGWQFSVNDRCMPVATRDVKIYSNEADVVPGIDGQYSPDAKKYTIPNTQIVYQVKLRAERQSPGSGRVYVIVHKVTDLNGHAGWGCSTVTIPIDGTPASIATVNALAATAQAACVATGTAPGGYVQVGTGPVVGPYQ